MPSNTAAWQPTPGVPLEVKEAPYTSPSDNEIVIKNHAIAVNPIDFKLQDTAYFPFVSYPTILGNDVAGEVVEVGSAASSRFKPGDRVLSQTASFGDPARCAFQEYSVVRAKLAAHIPDSMPFTDAAVIPLGISTAAVALFQKDQLALEHPSLSPKSTGQTLLVWSGASSVGVNAIQLAVAAGYEVFATASPKNFELIRSFGASQVFDYSLDSATLLEQLTAAFKNKTIAGVIHTAGAPERTVAICTDLFAQVEGNKSLSTTMPLSTDDIPTGFKYNRIFGNTLKDNEVGTVIYENFLPKALAEGKYKAAPEAEVVGQGLQALQKGLDLLRQGVSAKKLVVALD